MVDPHQVDPHDHKPVQHRDGKPPWCRTCGLDENFKDPVAAIPGTLPQPPDALPIMRYFNYSHLPHSLAIVSKPFCELAWAVHGMPFPDVEEKAFALRMLLLAKDAAVRTAV